MMLSFHHRSRCSADNSTFHFPPSPYPRQFFSCFKLKNITAMIFQSLIFIWLGPFVLPRRCLCSTMNSFSISLCVLCNWMRMEPKGQRMEAAEGLAALTNRRWSNKICAAPPPPEFDLVLGCCEKWAPTRCKPKPGVIHEDNWYWIYNWYQSRSYNGITRGFLIPFSWRKNRP